MNQFEQQPPQSGGQEGVPPPPPPQTGGYVPPPMGYYPPPPPPMQQGYYPPPTGYGYGYGVTPGWMPYVDPAEQQKRVAKQEIRKKANGLGAGLLFVEVIGSVLSLLLPFIIEMFIPGASGVEGIYYDALTYAIYSPLAILLSMWIGLKICKKKLADVTPFEKPKPLLWLGCILFSFLFIFAGNMAAGVVEWLSPHTVENMNTAFGTSPQTPFQLVIDILQTAAIPALVEELAFRGIALGVLRPYGDRFAILVSSLMFGLLHGNFIQIPFAFCVGLIMAYTVVRTGSIVPAVIIHFINNGMSCLLSYVGVPADQEKATIFTLCLYGIWVVLGLFGFVLLRFGFGQPLTACYKGYEGCLTPSQRNGAFFGAATIIVALVVYLLSAGIFALPADWFEITTSVEEGAISFLGGR